MTLQKLIRSAVAVALLATPVTIADPTDGWAQVGNIVVTARRREENLQDIPISVSQFGLQDIDRKSIDSIADLSLISSSVQFDTSAAPDSTRIVVRGLSPTRGRQNTAVLVDGIDVSSETIAQAGAGAFFNTRIVDLQRIEVVKGPQSALFGRSAFAGAIQFITQDPSEEFEAEVQVEAGNFERYEAQANVSGPITDQFGFRVSASWWDERGFFRNERTGEKIGNQDGLSITGTLRWDVNEDIWVRFRGEYVQQETGPSASVRVPFNVITPTPAGACLDLGGGAGSVFNCGPVASLSASDAAAFDAALNPTGVAAVAGPVTATNALIGGYAATVATQALFGQFRGAIPGRDDLPPVQLSPDPRSGNDFPGLRQDHIRLNLQAGWDIGFGEIRSWTGYFDGESHSMQDWQAAGDLSTCGTFVNVAASIATGTVVPASVGNEVSCVLAHNNNRHELTQIQQELRFASDWDFWAQLTVGGNFWYEKRDFFDRGGTVRARSIDCSNPPGTTFSFAAGPCGVFSVPITGDIFADAISARARAFGGQLNGLTGQRKLEHWSAYSIAEIDLDAMFESMFGGDLLGGGWSLILEGRYNRETESVQGQDSSATGSTGVDVCGGGPIFGSIGDNTTPNQVNGCSVIGVTFGADTGGPPLLPVTTANIDTRLCDFSAAELAALSPSTLATLFLNCDGDPSSPVKVGENSSDWLTGKFTLQWEPSESTLLYFSHAWAAKPEGFGTVSFGSAGFQPGTDLFEAERMRVYELGFKSGWLDGQLILNGAGFFQNYSEKQVNTQRIVPNPFVPGAFNTSNLVINASSAEVWGGEIDVIYAPDLDILGGRAVLSGSYTHLRARYKDFAIPNQGTDIRTTLSCEPFIDAAGAASCIVDRSGFTLEDAPEHSATMSASFVRPIGNICGCDVDMFWEADGQYTSRRFIEDANAAFADSWWNTNMRIGVQTEDYEFLFFVNNVFQGDGTQSGFTLPGLSCCFNFAHLRSGPGPTTAAIGGPIFNSGVVMANLRPPRHWGFRATARF